MISTIFLIFLMALIIFFFVAAMNNFSVSSIVYAAFLLFIWVKMIFSEKKEKGASTIYRRIFQIVFSAGFCIAFIGDLYVERGSQAITNSALSQAELPFCHIAIPQILTPLLITRNVIFPARITGHYAAVASMLLICLAVTFTVGRGWCSWICFYGGWEEGFSHLAKKRRLNLLSRNKEIREFQFGFLIFIALVSLCEMACAYCEWFCSFKLVTEFSPVNDIPSLIATVMFIGLFLALVVVLPILTKRRTQCSSLCPFGAISSLTDKISLFKIHIDTKKCKGCLKCASSCLFGAIDINTIQSKKENPEITCAKCGECIKVCPEKAIDFAFRFQKSNAENNITCGKSKGKKMPEILNPAQLYRFASFSFSVIMSGSFMVKALNIIAGVFVK